MCVSIVCVCIYCKCVKNGTKATLFSGYIKLFLTVCMEIYCLFGNSHQYTDLLMSYREMDTGHSMLVVRCKGCVCSVL